MHGPGGCWGQPGARRAIQLVGFGSQDPVPVVPGLLKLIGLLLRGVPKLALRTPMCGSPGSPFPRGSKL